MKTVIPSKQPPLGNVYYPPGHFAPPPPSAPIIFFPSPEETIDIPPVTQPIQGPDAIIPVLP